MRPVDPPVDGATPPRTSALRHLGRYPHQCDRLAGEAERGTDHWSAIRIKHFAGNVPFLTAPDGTPLWVSDVDPGSTHGLAAVRIHALPALYQATRDGLPTLADIGYIGAGGGIRIPFRKHPDLPSDTGLTNRTYNKLLRRLCFIGERAMAELRQRWRTRMSSSAPQRPQDPSGWQPEGAPVRYDVRTVGLVDGEGSQPSLCNDGQVLHGGVAAPPQA